MADYCYRCGEKLGLLSNKYRTPNGVVCSKCLYHDFVESKKVAGVLKINERDRKFMIGNDVFLYENLLNYELLENGHSIAKGGLGRAVAGGILFGGVGAIVGGVTGKKKSKNMCDSMTLCITLKDSYKSITNIAFISSATDTNSSIYRSAQRSAQEVIAHLQGIIASANNSTASASSHGVSAADEILKFQNLMNQGVITREEFETKKKQLLGL